ncbi:hypothetical protein HQ865_08785 [Mucilaginibacter mali]|uniref:Uncharacterized protein n=1 Tax=Mucilaginibacter mali TaxID=2740462 RepID=A0A7D4PYH2_9SPHI|nr:hypothetical protein [Mucilaginibacter mali]QKJ28206.1 hypothetical protein HQ865_08785 [Mucilaginibacter mali]
MSDTIIYQYANRSALKRSGMQDELFLAKYSEVQKSNEAFRNICRGFGLE